MLSLEPCGGTVRVELVVQKEEREVWKAAVCTTTMPGWLLFVLFLETVS